MVGQRRGSEWSSRCRWIRARCDCLISQAERLSSPSHHGQQSKTSKNGRAPAASAQDRTVCRGGLGAAFCSRLVCSPFRFRTGTAHRCRIENPTPRQNFRFRMIHDSENTPDAATKQENAPSPSAFDVTTAGTPLASDPKLRNSMTFGSGKQW